MRALSIIIKNLATSLRYPRVWLLAWLVVTVPALLVIAQVHEVMGAELNHHPGAGFLLDQSLDSDLIRLHPELGISLFGAGVFVCLAWVFLAGGVLSKVGRSEPFEFNAFLSDGARLFMRNLRVLCIGIVPVVLLFWGTEAFHTWLVDGPLRDVDPGATVVPLWLFSIRWTHLLEASLYLSGFLSLLLLLMSKIAMAHLAACDRRSALLAWAVAVGKCLRHPLRASLLVLWLGAALLILPAVIGVTTAWALEVGENLWLGLLLGQISIVSMQLVLMAYLLTARGLALGTKQLSATDDQPMMDIARRVESKTKKPSSKIIA